MISQQHLFRVEMSRTSELLRMMNDRYHCGRVAMHSLKHLHKSRKTLSWYAWERPRPVLRSNCFEEKQLTGGFGPHNRYYNNMQTDDTVTNVLCRSVHESLQTYNDDDSRCHYPASLQLQRMNDLYISTYSVARLRTPCDSHWQPSVARAK